MVYAKKACPLLLFCGEASSALPKIPRYIAIVCPQRALFSDKVPSLVSLDKSVQLDPNILEYFEAAPLGNYLERNMPVTRRAKHKANSFMAATKASTAWMGQSKSAKASMEFVQPIAVVAPRLTGDNAIETSDDVSNNTAKPAAGGGATSDSFSSKVATVDASEVTAGVKPTSFDSGTGRTPTVSANPILTGDKAS